MTIHSDWARLLHEECPEAFHTQLPGGDFDVGIIDGHLQLMCLHSGFNTWEVFLTAVFLRPIQRLFGAGCATVVLCFDSYDHVPAYKSMTQLKRARPHAPAGGGCVFGAEEELPDAIPEDTMTYLMNRHFKLKVIQLALARVPHMVQSLLEEDPARRFVVDYKCAVEYGGLSGLTPTPIPELVPLGESDIKYTRYIDRHGNALVHAIDGDYLAIALLYYATCGLRDDNRIFLFRQLSQLGGGSAAAARDEEDEAGGGKRKRASSAPLPKKKKKTPARPPKGWVDMQLLFTVVAQNVWQGAKRGRGGGGVPLNAHTLAPFTDADAVHAAVVLMLCAGTDFSRGMPLLGPKRLWEHLPAYAACLLQAAPWGGRPDPALLASAVIGTLYKTIFARHVDPGTATLASVLRQLRTSSLSPTTTARLPSEAQVEVTLHNIAWVMAYWSAANSAVPTPLDGSNGYVRCPYTQEITFADLAAAPPRTA
jgi:hypothetical protein